MAGHEVIDSIPKVYLYFRDHFNQLLLARFFDLATPSGLLVEGLDVLDVVLVLGVHPWAFLKSASSIIGYTNIDLCNPNTYLPLLYYFV